MDLQSAAFLAITITPVFLQWLLKKNTPKLPPPDSTNTYRHIFVKNQNIECRFHLSKREPCGDWCSYSYLKRIASFISSAKFTIDMCMYHLTCSEIAAALIKSKLRGVNVRFITDEEMAHSSGAQARNVREAGIIVKTPSRSTSFMHHKFCVLDRGNPEQKMFLGSLNLTLQGLTSNWENLTFTDNVLMIDRFTEEFNELWESLNEMQY